MSFLECWKVGGTDGKCATPREGLENSWVQRYEDAYGPGGPGPDADIKSSSRYVAQYVLALYWMTTTVGPVLYASTL
jgi:hypothetical protein